MPLKFKSLGTRTLSALFFVVVLLTCLLYSYTTFTVFFLIVAMWGLKEFFGMAAKMDYVPLTSAGYIVGFAAYLAFIRLPWFGGGWPFLGALVILPFILLALPVFLPAKEQLRNVFVTIIAIIYTVVPFGLLHHIVFTFEEGVAVFFPKTLLGIILLIWCNDTFAYLGGSLFGKHKMIERISPGKTWEGTITGILFSIGGSFVISSYIGRDQQFWLFAGIIVPVLATVGDLVQSLAKRQAGLKDSGNVLPGHGGILDRFDSLIFVSPFVVALIKLIAIQSVSG